MIAVDWGTSSFRAYRINKEGTVLEKRETALGVLQVTAGGFPAAFEAQTAEWLVDNKGPIILSGMAGSRHGWLEVPYVPCPAGLAELAAHLVDVRWGDYRARIVPGLSGTDESGIADVMRGEETQIMGALNQLPPDATVCLPGTHSKWVRVRDGKIVSFATHMTGEVFAVLKEHSILGRTMHESPPDPAAFKAGIQRARSDGGLLHHLFGVRARGLAGDLPATAQASYLSGILIGHELASAITTAGDVYLLGSGTLMDLYREALKLFDCRAVVLDPDSAARGMYALAKKASQK